MAEEKQEQQPDRESTIDSEGFSEFKVKVDPPESYFYANITGLSVSPLDIRLNFASVEPTKDETIEARTIAGVIMSPEHAAQLAILLTKQLSSYERRFGQIRSQEWRAMMEQAQKNFDALRKPKEAEEEAGG